MKDEKFLVITINSTHLVMKIEQILLKNNLSVKIVPLPTELSASCGFSIRGEICDAKKILELLKENNIEENLYKFFICEKQGFKKKFFAFSF